MKQIKQMYSNLNNKVAFFTGLYISVQTIVFTIILTVVKFSKSDAQGFAANLLNLEPIFYFTHHSNMFFGVALLLFGWKDNEFYKRLLFSSVALMFFTILIYWAFIFDWTQKNEREGEYLSKVWAWSHNVITHIIVPILSFVFLALYRKQITITYKTFMWINIYILSYVGFMLVVFLINFIATKGQVVGYDFTDPFKPFGYKGGNIFLIILLDILLVLLFVSSPSILIIATKFSFNIKYQKLKTRY
ncbi:MAGa3780 family membrane protein [Mycoplasma procyoni]|uniref:MAGa3780 family membrane protein n=1 Tax=Mycoplasma procyoni TaxID=568784 RepID=UPI00197B46BA|nr:hypothetical protein [Mycoplasma procyoni]MBN3535020.1 hypothetical protein [Mycoplasma procyoni]